MSIYRSSCPHPRVAAHVPVEDDRRHSRRHQLHCRHKHGEVKTSVRSSGMVLFIHTKLTTMLATQPPLDTTQTHAVAGVNLDDNRLM